jgi:hypothetical protein
MFTRPTTPTYTQDNRRSMPSTANCYCQYHHIECCSQDLHSSVAAGIDHLGRIYHRVWIARPIACAYNSLLLSAPELMGTGTLAEYGCSQDCLACFATLLSGKCPCDPRACRCEVTKGKNRGRRKEVEADQFLRHVRRLARQRLEQSTSRPCPRANRRVSEKLV